MTSVWVCPDCGSTVGDHDCPGRSAAPDDEREHVEAVAEQVLDNGYPFPILHRWWHDKARELAQFILKERDRGPAA